jgi:hypothetical protein
LPAIVLMTIASASTQSVSVAEQTWTGRISDDVCAASHHVRRDPERRLSDRECTIDCIKAFGRYVLVETSGAIIPIANQDFPGLPLRADRLVRVNGTLKDDAIVLSSISTTDLPVQTPKQSVK